MTRAHRIALAVFSAGSIAALSSARADTEPRSRAVIRGTGKDVQIVYRAPRAVPGVTASAADPVTAALERKTAGETDQAVLAYLSAHRDDLPDVVSADALRRLRKAGAGDPVIAFLSSNAAVDIGATAEDGVGPVQEIPAPGAPYAGAYPDLVSSGYPFYGAGGYGGYGGYAGYGHGGHFRGGFGKMGHGFFGPGSGFFLGFGHGFGNGFGHGHGFGPRPQPHSRPIARGGGSTHAAVTGGGRRR